MSYTKTKHFPTTTNSHCKKTQFIPAGSIAAPMEFHDGKVHIHRVSKIEPNTGETLVLDLLIVTPEIKNAWDSRKKVEWEHGIIDVVSLEGLILLKSFRKSGQDQDDIDFLRSIIDED